MMPTSARRFGTIHTATDGRDILANSPDGWEVERPWLWFDGPADGDGTGGPWGNPPPGAEYGAPSMRGTTLPAFTRCLQLIAPKIAGMPWKVYRGRDAIPAPGWIVDPQATRRDGRLLAAPGPDVRFSPVEFWETYIISYLTWGEGIVYTPRMLDDDGQPTGQIVAPIYNLHPAYVHVDEGRYYVDDDLADDGRTYIDPRELIVTRNIVRPGRERGLGAIQAHAYDLGFAADVRAYTDNLFQRGIPNGYLKSTKPDLDQATADRLKRNWMTAHGNVRKSIAVLNATTEFQPLTIDPQIVAVSDMMRLTAWQIALILGVPPSRLGISMGESNTYSNLESQNTAFIQDTHLPIARKLEAAIDAVLPAGQSLKIDFRQELRGDTTTRYDAYSVGLAAGFLTLDEVRAAEDLPPLDAPTAAPTDPPTDPADTQPTEDE